MNDFFANSVDSLRSRLKTRCDQGIRDVPYPYEAMLAVCSDLDETPDRLSYLEIARFLNTEEETAVGRGVGLEFGNTIYFDMPGNQFAYWNTDDAGREMVRKLIRSGHIDCFHSFGDLATTREHAERAIKELERHDCKLECWIDHSCARTNLGADIMKGSGDIIGAEAYHADLIYAHGVRFVWRGRVTSMIGQNCTLSLRGLFSSQYPVASLRTIAIEAAKITSARMGNKKYAMHARNELLRVDRLRDGRPIFEFMRCNPYWGGVGNAATADGLSEVLTSRFLDRLISRKGCSILYTHLGKVHSPDQLFSANTVAALRELAKAMHRGDILVTTTRRLLGYYLHSSLASCRIEKKPSGELVYIDALDCRSSTVPVDLSGLTIYVQNAASAHLFLNGREYQDVQRNPADRSGRESLSIPWERLRFPL